MKFLILVILLNCCLVFGDNDPPIVKVKQGKLLGKILKSREGRIFFGFMGVPYAQAERFQASNIAPKWDGILEATTYRPKCAQRMWVLNENQGVEDCLHLQVFTPSLTDNLSVMVYFHGGGFNVGTGNVLQPHYFMDEDVVVVVVNYRLGPFGFLSTQDEQFPGNNGLKDQNVALKWVKENIAEFGGNPGNVTIFGNSAGGASVQFHMLSPQSAGLFHAAIMQSGCVLNPWVISRNPKEMAFRFSKSIGCPTADSLDFKNCLLTKTTEEILNAMGPLVQWGYDPFSPFAVVVEPDLPGAFITVDPMVTLKSGRFHKVPVITGVTQDEGILMHSAYVFDRELLQDFNDNWKRVLPITLEYDELYTNFTTDQQLQISEKIRKFYFQDRDISEETRQELTNVYSDRFFNHGVRNNALVMAEYVPVYIYQFAHDRGDFSGIQLFGINEIFGVSHSDELSFLFGNTFGRSPEFQKGSIAEQVSKDFVKLWVSFAKNGSPTLLWGKQKVWQPISSDERTEKNPLRYYRMDSDTSLIDEPFTDRIKFWENILSSTNSRYKDEL